MTFVRIFVCIVLIYDAQTALQGSGIEWNRIMGNEIIFIVMKNKLKLFQIIQ